MNHRINSCFQDQFDGCSIYGIGQRTQHRIASPVFTIRILGYPVIQIGTVRIEMRLRIIPPIVFDRPLMLGIFMIYQKFIINLLAGVYASEQCLGVNDRFENRTGLPAGPNMVKLGEVEISATDPCPDKSGTVFHRHNSDL